jgi:hypothetical protein
MAVGNLALVWLGVAMSLSPWGCAPGQMPGEPNPLPPKARHLPAAPPGYEWYTCNNGVGTFLRPNGWFVKEETVKNINALFITKREFDPPGRFDIGLTVNQITRFSRHHPLPPSLYAKVFIATATERMELIGTETVKGNFTDMHVARVRGSNHGIMTIIQYIAIGVDDQDILYLLFFEAPEKAWEREVRIGGPMLDTFALGPPSPAVKPPDEAERLPTPTGLEPGRAL